MALFPMGVQFLGLRHVCIERASQARIGFFNHVLAQAILNITPPRNAVKKTIISGMGLC